MNLKMKIKNVVIAFAGNFLLGIGIGLFGLAKMGADPIASFSQAASIKFGITFGQMVTITNSCLLICVLLIKKEYVGIATLIVVLFNQYSIDLVPKIINYTDSFLVNVLWILLGIVLVAIGCCMVMASDMGMGIYDAFLSSLAFKFNRNYVFVRYIADFIFLVLTFVLGGYIGVGTLLGFFLLGYVINFIRPIVFKNLK